MEVSVERMEILEKKVAELEMLIATLISKEIPKSAPFRGHWSRKHLSV